MNNSEITSYINDLGEGCKNFMAKYDKKFNALENLLALAGAPSGGGYFPESSGFRSLGEFGRAVMEATRPGGQTDERLLKIRAAASGANEGIPSEGGFLVGQDQSNELLRSVFDVALVASRCNRIPISANSNGIKLNAVDETSRVNGSRWGGVQSYWAAEAATVTATKPKFRQIDLLLRKLFAICYCTDELLADVPALGAVLMQAFTEEIAFKVDDGIINGVGSGAMLGILNSGALVTVDAETGQIADTILYENIVNMYARMPGRNRKNAVWFVNQDVETQLFQMRLAVGTGGIPIYMPAGGAADSPFSTLFGRPVIPIEQCATLGDKGDIILCDPSAYVLIDKGGIQAASSIHLMFLTDESTFRWVYRCDGAPMLAAPITPFKGANQLSPFVTLAAR